MESLFLRLGLLLAAMLSLCPVAQALTADQIVLIVNRNEPAGMELARFYAAARGIPLDRILELQLPTTEEMPFDRYERLTAPAVRKFLRERGLDQQVRCLVTFYGVPLRISNRENGPAENIELGRLREEMGRILRHIQPMVLELETRAVGVDPNFKPVNADTSFEALGRRGTLAGQAIEQALLRATDVQTRMQLAEYLREMTAKLSAPMNPQAAAAPPTTMTAAELMDRPFDPEARLALRKLAEPTGVFGYGRLIQSQIEYFQTDATGSAVDNELALVFWPPYTRVRWQENPLHAKYLGVRSPQTLMVMRLDAPHAQLVKDMIANGLATERQGLTGRAAIDARSIAPRKNDGAEDAFGVFDQRFRDLAAFLQKNTSMPVVLDDRPDVFPAEPKIDDLAIYTGWYSLQNYIPAYKFNRGAVGYHVASFELMHLHGPATGQWVRNLLENGVVGTLGPVAEPYLHSFPPPDDFFPLLLTGKLTLAEVYWSTTPLTSWMQTAIGDPLYTPFAKNPQVKPTDLPQPLQKVVEAAIQAATPNGR